MLPGADHDRGGRGLPGIGVGTWAWGNQFLWGYDPGQDAELEDGFHRAVNLGLRFFDTADSYGTGRFQGRSESLLGRFTSTLTESGRRRLTVATKLAPFPWRWGRQGLRRAFEASRERLGGKLDRVQLHWSTSRYAPWQEPALIEGLADLVETGQVAGLGVSNMGPCRLRAVHRQLNRRGIPLLSVQVQMSLLSPEAVETGGVADVCSELGIDLIGYSPLALGLLARPPGDLDHCPVGPRGLLFRRMWPRLQPLLSAMEMMASGRGGSMAGVALNWCRSHGAMPIPGLRRCAQVNEAAAALQWQLDPAELDELDHLALNSRCRMPANPFSSS